MKSNKVRKLRKILIFTRDVSFGGFIYNHMSALGGVDNVAYIQEAATLDTCGGHSDGSCTYHFHSFNTHDDCTADGKWN